MRPHTLASRRRLYLLSRVIVQRHYRQELTLERVARALASSPRQLQRAYAQFGRLTFREDLHARRMDAAAELLTEQQAIPVGDVARLVGYRHAPHFARAFRRRYGLAPAVFRERALVARGARQSVAPAVAASSATDGSSGSARGRRRRISVPPPVAGSAVTVPP